MCAVNFGIGVLNIYTVVGTCIVIMNLKAIINCCFWKYSISYSVTYIVFPKGKYMFNLVLKIFLLNTKIAEWISIKIKKEKWKY